MDTTTATDNYLMISDAEHLIGDIVRCGSPVLLSEIEAGSPTCVSDTITLLGGTEYIPAGAVVGLAVRTSQGAIGGHFLNLAASADEIKQLAETLDAFGTVFLYPVVADGDRLLVALEYLRSKGADIGSETGRDGVVYWDMTIGNYYYPRLDEGGVIDLAVAEGWAD